MHNHALCSAVAGVLALLASAACGSASEGEVVVAPDSHPSDTELPDDTGEVDDPDIPDVDVADGADNGGVRPPACGARECGYLPDGTRCGGCFSAKDGLLSTFCDESTGTCASLTARCEDGWCEVPAGSFQGGWPTEGGGQLPYYEFPPHDVVLTRSFRIQQTEVTQAQWLELMATNPSPFAACGLDCPISGQTGFDALEFANRLSARDGLLACYDLTGCVTHEAGSDHGRDCERAVFVGPDCTGYRLPSEFEWEHAAKAGSPYCFAQGPISEFDLGCTVDPDTSEFAWYCANSQVMYEGCVDLSHLGDDASACAGVQPVGLTPPNRLGIHDMSGNVYESTGSLWEEPRSDVVLHHDAGFAVEFLHGDLNTTRGGCYSLRQRFVCTALRSHSGLGFGENRERLGLEGFRLVQTIGAEPVP